MKSVKQKTKQRSGAEVAAMAQRPSEVMTSQEVAELLQLSIRTIKRLVDDGHLPFSKISHSVRFSRRRLIELVYNGVNTNIGPRAIRTRNK